jgi:ParB family transcriptional regulator, chromosome partitioning protein
VVISPAMATKVNDIERDSFCSPIFPAILEDISVTRIKEARNQLRSGLDSHTDLILSIQQKGLLQPILIRTINDGHYEVVAGNRRLHACRILGWKKVACHVVQLNDKEAFELSLIENIQRRSLNPIEEGQAFKKYVSEFGWGGASDLAQKIGKSASYVTKRIKLLELPSDILDSVKDLTINASAAEELLSTGDKERQSELAKLIRMRHLSTKNVRAILKDIDDNPNNGNNRDADYISFSGIASSDLRCSRAADDLEKARKSIEKSIVILKIAINRIATIIENTESDWIVYEILMQHKNAIHAEISTLIKQKMKYRQLKQGLYQ